MPDDTFRFRLGREDVPVIRDFNNIADRRVREVLTDINLVPATRTVEADYSFDTLNDMLDPGKGLNPVLNQIVEQIRASGFDPTVAGGHGKGSFSLTW